MPTFFFALAGVETFVSAWFYTTQPAETSNAILFGLSLKKFILFAGLSGLGLAFCALAILIWRGGKLNTSTQSFLNDSAKRDRAIKFLLWASAALWLILAVPAVWFGNFEASFAVVKPVLVLMCVLAVQALFFLKLGAANESFSSTQSFVRENKKTIQLWAGILLAMCATWAVIAISKIGLDSHNEDYWYEAGVPVLGLQALAGLLAGLAFHWYENRNADSIRPRRLDAVVFFAVWIFSGAIWALTPAPNGFLNPGPYPPAYETYPFADAATYDLMSQFALIGQGLNNNSSYNRPAYPAFLVLVHALTGQDYESNLRFQAALLGIFPALIYLIGKNLLGRGAGLAAAIAILLRGINGILATNTLNLANQKQMLADFPAGVGICAVTLICILWLQSPNKRYLALWAGGLLAFTAYLRPTAIALLPLLLIVPFVIKSYSWRVRGATAAMLVVGFVLVMTPWEVRSAIVKDNYKYPTPIGKIISVVRARYPSLEIKVSKPNDDAPRTPSLDTKPDSSKQEQTPKAAGSIGLSFIANHFFHNLATSALSLPNSAGYQSLRAVIKSEDSVWTSTWAGELGLGGSLILLINLALLALGMGLCIQQRAWAGLFPVAVFGIYQMANALGRTSGGRYIVPVDWVLVLLFCLGLFSLGLWLVAKMGWMRLATVTRPERGMSETTGGDASSRRLSLVACASLLGLGLLLLLPDVAFKREFVAQSREQLVERLFSYDLNGNDAYVLEFLKDQKSVILNGEILYPRYYNVGGGEVPTGYPYQILDFPRLAFVFIGPGKLHNAIMAAPAPDNTDRPAIRFSLNTAHAILLGCADKTNVDVVMLVFYEQPDVVIYSRQPAAPPSCPLPELVCKEDEKCE